MMSLYVPPHLYAQLLAEATELNMSVKALMISKLYELYEDQN